MQRPENLLRLIKNEDTKGFKPFVFWSLNAELEKDEMLRQIGEMKKFGLGGFVFHARTGLKTEYLSEKWFSLFDECRKKAKELGMKVWIYDENGWPSGFCGGKLLKNPNFRACFLRYEILDFYDENAYAVYLYGEDGVKRLHIGETAEKYHTIYYRKSDSYTDILNPLVTDAFIKSTHEEYYARFKDGFGKEIAGFFTDEPQYYRYETPISSVAEEEYAKAYGENVKDGLLYLFLEDEKGYPFRIKYYNLLSRLYCENFYGRIRNWCENHGCLLTGHSVEETTMTTQMLGGADCAITYAYEDIPAIDNLQKSCSAKISAKLVGSAAAQLGKKTVITETFGVSGYSVTPENLKLIADKQYVYGVNTMIQHLYDYSLAGQGKIDCPPNFGRTLPWVEFYPYLNDYFTRLGFLIAESTEIAPVAVITPMESVYLDYIRLNTSAARNRVDKPFMKALSLLSKNGICYHFVNEKMLEKHGTADKNILNVGERKYSAVVVANCVTLKRKTVETLGRFFLNGGKICILGNEPKYIDGEKMSKPIVVQNCAIDELPKPIVVNFSDDVSFSYREINGTRFLFAVNENDTPVNVRTEKSFSEVDLNSKTAYKSKNEHIIQPKSSIVLEENGAYSDEKPKFLKETDLVPSVIGEGLNSLTIENVSVACENGENLAGYNYGVFETLVKREYSGTLRVAFEFESDKERTILITVEKQSAARDEKFNGKGVSFFQSVEDAGFKSSEVIAKKGKNFYGYSVDFGRLSGKAKILYDGSVPESILNCFTYDTGLEQVYVCGEFDTEGYKLVEKKQKNVGNLSEQGLSNFYGKVIYAIDLCAIIRKTKSCGKISLLPVGDFAAIKIIADGKEYGNIFGEETLINVPKNPVVKIECYSTLKNRFGPFHSVFPDDGITPDSFTLRKNWKNEKENPYFNRERTFIPFGISKVKVKF